MVQFQRSLSGSQEDYPFSDDLRRSSGLRALRSLALIGLSEPLFPWETRRQQDLSKIKSKKTRKFYKTQNEAIDSLEVIDELLDSGIHAALIEEYGDDIGIEAPRQRRRQPHTIVSPSSSSDESMPLISQQTVSPRVVHFWINLNMAANVFLLLAKIAVVYMTDSLSIFASLVDSVLDLLSTVIIFLSATFADSRDWKTKHLYPVGRYRLEPIGVLVFSIIMVLSFIKIAQEALAELLAGPDGKSKVVITNSSFVVMLGTIVIKGVLWELCRHYDSSSVQALSQDALTDCVFNFFSLLFPLLSHLVHNTMLDPLGALLLAVYVVYSWGETAMEHINNLTGAACSPDERRQLLYLCIRFSERIKYVTALNAYHAGDRLMCEVDVLLDPSLSMRDAHDVAEALQYALETLAIVERAFVHIDYRRDNFSGHVV